MKTIVLKESRKVKPEGFIYTCNIRSFLQQFPQCRLFNKKTRVFHCCKIKITGLLVNIKRNRPNPLLFNLRTANLKSSHSHLSPGYKFVCSLTNISLWIQQHNLLGLQALSKMTYATRIKENDELLKYLPTVT